MPAKKAAKSGKRSGLSKKQMNQRKYASAMRGVRKRAKKAAGGKGRIAKRRTASTMRKKLGLKSA